MSVESLAADVARLEGEADASDEAVAQVLAAAVRLYSSQAQRDGVSPAIEPGVLVPTDAMIACTALLRAVNVQVFELGCWQGWMG